jgi:hypothetical protein
MWVLMARFPIQDILTTSLPEPTNHANTSMLLPLYRAGMLREDVTLSEVHRLFEVTDHLVPLRPKLLKQRSGVRGNLGLLSMAYSIVQTLLCSQE